MSIKQLAIQIARFLRKNQTKAEKVFWHAVRSKYFYGKKIRQQHPLLYEYDGKEKFFIADFYCPGLDLIIEIDGGVHEQQQDYDQIRSEILEVQHKLRVVRFTNKEVLTDINHVLNQLKQLF